MRYGGLNFNINFLMFLKLVQNISSKKSTLPCVCALAIYGLKLEMRVYSCGFFIFHINFSSLSNHFSYAFPYSTYK